MLLQLDDEEKRYANADDAQSVEQSDRIGVEHRLHERRVGEGELHGHHQRHAISTAGVPSTPCQVMEGRARSAR